ncbi:MAG: DoxX family protein [Pseudomonadota bacterium]
MTLPPFATRLSDRLDAAAPAVLTSLARFVFAAVLLIYYWNSGQTKLGDGILGIVRPDFGAYAQIFPKAMEAAGYDVSQLGLFHWAVVVAGTWAEFILPLLIVLGLATRLAAVGMIGFIAVQSLVDITGHGLDAASIGGWFDRDASALILDQRAFWVLGLLILVFRGGGPVSLDRLLFKHADA